MTSKIQPHKSFTNTITNQTVKKPEKPTEKRVVNIPVEVGASLNLSRELKADEFNDFVLKDKDGNILQTVKNILECDNLLLLNSKKGQEGTHNYTVEGVKGVELFLTIQ